LVIPRPLAFDRDAIVDVVGDDILKYCQKLVKMDGCLLKNGKQQGCVNGTVN